MIDQRLGGGAWRLAALPGEIGVGGERGPEGTEDEPVREGGGNESVDADCRAESRVHEMRRIIEQVVGRDDVQLREGLSEPAAERGPAVRHAAVRLRERSCLLRRRRENSGECEVP